MRCDLVSHRFTLDRINRARIYTRFKYSLSHSYLKPFICPSNNVADCWKIQAPIEIPVGLLSKPNQKIHSRLQFRNELPRIPNRKNNNNRDPMCAGGVSLRKKKQIITPKNDQFISVTVAANALCTQQFVLYAFQRINNNYRMSKQHSNA